MLSELHINLFLMHFSFYNWETQTAVATSSPNYTVIAENANGLLFKNKRDRKIINVDPSVSRMPISLTVSTSELHFLHPNILLCKSK